MTFLFAHIVDFLFGDINFIRAYKVFIIYELFYVIYGITIIVDHYGTIQISAMIAP